MFVRAVCDLFRTAILLLPLFFPFLPIFLRWILHRPFFRSVVFPRGARFVSARPKVMTECFGFLQEIKKSKLRGGLLRILFFFFFFFSAASEQTDGPRRSSEAALAVRLPRGFVSDRLLWPRGLRPREKLRNGGKKEGGFERSHMQSTS